MARSIDLNEAVSTRRLVARPRLIERLQARWTADVVVIRAAAGFGKTSLVNQALAHNLIAPRGVDRAIACEPDDRWTALATALADALEIEEELPVGDVDRATALLRSALAKWSPTPVCLTVDDVHLVAADSDGTALLQAVIDALPANGHVVLAGRTAAALALGRIAAANRLVTIEEAELGFDDDELRSFASARGTDAEAFRFSGRWPALAELEAAARKGRVSQVGTTWTREFVWEEVLSRLPVGELRALAVAVVVGGGDQGVLDAALSAIGDGSIAVDAVVDLPLVAVSSGWIFPHSLWSAHVGDVLTGPERQAAQQAAADVLLVRNRFDAAFALYRDIAAVNGMLRVVRTATTPTAPPIAADVLGRWLNDLPPETTASAEADLLRAILVKAEDQDPRRAQELFLASAARFENAGDLDAELSCLVHLMQVVIWTGDRAGQVKVLGRVLELEQRGHGVAGTLAAIGRAVIHRWSGDLRRGRDELRSIDLSSVHESWQAVVQCQLASIEVNIGNLEEALELVDRARPYLANEFHALADQVESYALWFLGRMDECDRHNIEMIRSLERLGRRQPLDLARATFAFLEASRGEVSKAAALLSQIEPGPSPYTAVSSKVAAAEASIDIHHGCEADAAAVLIAEGERFPIEANWTSRVSAAALYYVLSPATRPLWDSEPMAATFEPGLALARALLDLRAGHLRALADIGVATERLLLHVPGRWATELAVGGEPDDDQVIALAEDHPIWLRGLTDHPAKAIATRAAKLVRFLPDPPPQPATLRLLGQSTVTHGSSRPLDLGRPRVRQLVTLMVTRRKVSRDQVLAMLWPDLERPAAANNLRVTASHLRSALEPSRSAGAPPFVVRLHDGVFTLAPPPWLLVDVWQFEDAYEEALVADRDGDLTRAVALYLEAVEWYRGDLDPTSELDWAVGAAQTLRGHFASAALRAGEILLAQSEPQPAAKLARQVLDHDPYAERAHRLLAAAQLALGQRSAARQTIDLCLAALEDLGVTPDPATAILTRTV